MGILLCLLLICALMLRVTCVIHAGGSQSFAVTLSWQIGRIRFPLRRIWPRRQPRKDSAKPNISFMTLISALRRSKHWQRLGRHIHLQRLSISAGISLADAARSAQLCGLLNLIPKLFPTSWQEHVTVQVLPDFWSGRQSVAAECIISSRLGILLTDAAWLLITVMRLRRPQHKEA